MKTNSTVKLLKLSLPVLIIFLIINSCTKESSSNPAESISSQHVDNDSAITNGLVAWYTFENGSLQDKSGKGNNIIFNNATPVADRNGHAKGAYRFNGINDYMRVPNSSSLSITDRITLFAIVKVNGFYSGECHGNRIFQKGYDDNTSGNYFLGFDDDYYYNNTNCYNPVDPNHESFIGHFGNNLIDKSFGIDTTNYIKTKRWYTIAFTYNGFVGRLYVNGKLKYSDKKTITIKPNTDDLFIGTTNINDIKFPYWFNGVIDEIRI